MRMILHDADDADGWSPVEGCYRPLRYRGWQGSLLPASSPPATCRHQNKLLAGAEDREMRLNVAEVSGL